MVVLVVFEIAEAEIVVTVVELKAVVVTEETVDLFVEITQTAIAVEMVIMGTDFVNAVMITNVIVFVDGAVKLLM